MTTPTTTRKICTFFFTGLDRSRLTNLGLDLIKNTTNVSDLMVLFVLLTVSTGWHQTSAVVTSTAAGARQGFNNLFSSYIVCCFPMFPHFLVNISMLDIA